VLGLGLFATILGGLPVYAGEDPLVENPAPDNWHHEGLTTRATPSPEWAPGASTSLAFHTDYVDSYLYSPIWWFNPAKGGGADRLRVVMSSQEDLLKVHFDDLFDPAEIRSMWRRYLSGTVCGLLWVARQNVDLDMKVAMAHNVIGVSLHALQDFWSHSNWIDDPARRNTTWFEADPSDRAGMSLWTGSYELPDHLGIKPHGGYEFECSLFDALNGVGRALMNVACQVTPLANSPACEALARCTGKTTIELPSVAGLRIPPNVVFVKKGINLDTQWLSVIGVAERGLSPGLSSADAFKRAYQLAARTSCQWLHILGHVMDNATIGDANAQLGTFWTEVRQRGVPATAPFWSEIGPWERLDQIPYRFISTGPYPPNLDAPDTDQWYLRLSVATANVDLAGTNADLIPFVDDVPIVEVDGTLKRLDQGPRFVDPTPGYGLAGSEIEALLGFDDHERGATTAYYLGPFATLPSKLAILNDAPTTAEVVEAFGRSVVNAIVTFFTTVAGFFLSLVGAAADYIGEAHEIFGADELDALGPGNSLPFSIPVEGGAEGRYTIAGRVEATPVTGVDSRGVPWREYWVRVETLRCIEQSDFDRFTPSDEPFIVGVVLPQGGTDSGVRWMVDPVDNVRTGDVRSIVGKVFPARVPPRFGFLTVAVAMYESDGETPNDRTTLMNTFAGTSATSTLPAREQFAVVLSEAIASGWRPERIEVVAFRRGATAEVVEFAPEVPDRWVYGGELLEWTLQETGRVRADVPDALTCKCKPECPPVTDPPPLRQDQLVDQAPPGTKPGKKPETKPGKKPPQKPGKVPVAVEPVEVPAGPGPVEQQVSGRIPRLPRPPAPKKWPRISIRIHRNGSPPTAAE
jgi:hypothetical protein